VLDDQDRMFAEADGDVADRGLARALGDETRREEERGADPREALEGQVAAHELGQAPADHQAQARTAVLARRRAVGLGEGLEQGPLLLDGNADSRFAPAPPQLEPLGRRWVERRRLGPGLGLYDHLSL